MDFNTLDKELKCFPVEINKIIYNYYYSPEYVEERVTICDRIKTYLLIKFIGILIYIDGKINTDSYPI